MPLPIFAWAAIATVTALGGYAGMRGASRFSKAKKEVEAAHRRHKRWRKRIDKRRTDCVGRVERLVLRASAIRDTTFRQTTALLEAIGSSHKGKTFELLKNIGVSAPVAESFSLTEEFVSTFMSGGVGAIASGTAASNAVTAGVIYWGTASTGTAISSLSGAAASNATLAWLGGGSLAVGGGGVAAGTVVLAGVAVAPAIAIAGLTIAIKGEKELTRAKEHVADVEKGTASIKTMVEFLQRFAEHVDERRSVIDSLDLRAREALGTINPEEFDKTDDDQVVQLQQLILCVTGISQVLQAPLLDEGGELSIEGISIVGKYREFSTGGVN